MATLPTLRPTSYITGNNVSTTAVGNVNDDSDSTFNSSSVTPDTTGFWRYHMADMPTDFVSMDSFTIHVRMRLSATGDDTWQARARLVDASGNALSATPSYSTISSAGFTTFTFTPSFTGTNNKATWDGVCVRIGFSNAKNMAPDNNQLQVADVWITGTYTAGAQPLTGSTFTKAPTFPQGSVTGPLTGSTFTKAPTFPVGAVSVVAQYIEYGPNAATPYSNKVELTSPDAGLAATFDGAITDLCVRYRLAMSDWNPGSTAGHRYLHLDWYDGDGFGGANADEKLILMWDTDGEWHLGLQRSINGEINTQALPTTPLSIFADGDIVDVELIFDGDNGSSQHAVTLNYRINSSLDLDDNSGWTAGSTVTFSGTDLIQATSGVYPYHHGGHSGTAPTWTRLYRSMAWIGLSPAGSLLWDLDPNDPTQTADNGATFTDNAGNVWTLAGDAEWSGATEQLAGVLFAKAPTFPQGTVAPGAVALTGTAFIKAPTFPTGTLTTSYQLNGVTYAAAPSFPVGQVSPGAVAVTGTTFVRAPSFPAGTVAPGAVALSGSTFVAAPTFPVGAITFDQQLDGSTFTKAPSFFGGDVLQGVTLAGVLFAKAPTFLSSSARISSSPLPAPTWVSPTPATGSTQYGLNPGIDLAWQYSEVSDPTTGLYRLTRFVGELVYQEDFVNGIDQWGNDAYTVVSHDDGEDALSAVLSGSPDGTSWVRQIATVNLSNLQTYGIDCAAGDEFVVLVRWRNDENDTVFEGSSISISTRMYFYDSSGSFVGQTVNGFSGTPSDDPFESGAPQATYLDGSYQVAPASSAHAQVVVNIDGMSNGDTWKLLEVLVLRVNGQPSADAAYDDDSPGWVANSGSSESRSDVDAVTSLTDLNVFDQAPTSIPADFAAVYVVTVQPLLDGSEVYSEFRWFYVETALLEGITFVKAPTFPQGTVALDAQPVDGVLFARAPTFPAGAISTSYQLSGSTFTIAPTFPTGTITASYQLAGVTYALAPTFFAGELITGQPIDGVLFTRAPTFPQGTITPGAVALTGATFTQAPTFPVGQVTPGAVTVSGSTFTKAPTFPTGTVTPGAVTVSGSTLTVAPTFPTGVVTYSQLLSGVTYAVAPTFPQGVVAEEGFLVGTTFVLAPTFFAGTVAPGAVTLSGATFTRAPSFGGGAITTQTTISGSTFTQAPTFFVGDIVGVQPLVGSTFVSAPSFGGGDILVGPVTITASAVLQVGPTFPTGSLRVLLVMPGDQGAAADAGRRGLTADGGRRGRTADGGRRGSTSSGPSGGYTET